MKTKYSKRVAILATDGFEEIELTKPLEILEDNGIAVEIVAPKSTIWSYTKDTKGSLFPADVYLDEAVSLNYDGLILPGGIKNPDSLRQNHQALAFVKSFFVSEKPVAAICHGPWTLIDAGVLQGRVLTSYPSLKTDIENAGAKWVNDEVFLDRNLITSRYPKDLEKFIATFIECLETKKHFFQYA